MKYLAWAIAAVGVGWAIWEHRRVVGLSKALVATAANNVEAAGIPIPGETTANTSTVSGAVVYTPPPGGFDRYGNPVY